MERATCWICDAEMADFWDKFNTSDEARNRPDERYCDECGHMVCSNCWYPGTRCCKECEAREEPIPMILHCPACGTQHVDAPEPASGWTNPPHTSHLCHNPACRTVWRPADVPTVGVAALETRGARDTWPQQGDDHCGT